MWLRKVCIANPQEVYDYWEKKNWLTHKGEEVKTLEAACNAYNSVAISRDRKKAIRELNNERLKQATERKVRKEDYVSYKEQLKDRRWEEFREKVKFIRGYKCEKCGSQKILQVHHKRYKRGLKAWEYDIKDLIVLCRDCHEKAHNIKRKRKG